MMKKQYALMAIVYVLAFLGIQGMSGVVVKLVSVALKESPLMASYGAQTILSMVLFSVAAVVVFVWARWFKPSASYMRSRPWVVLLWSVMAALGAIIPSMFCQELMPEWPKWLQEIVDQSERQLVMLMQTRGGYFVLALLAPVVEEMVFRGCVLRDLLRWQPERRWLMIGLSALLFALSHINPAQMPHAFVIGVLLGWMYSRTGSIVPGIAFHWANNTAAYLFYVMYPNPHIRLVDVFGGRHHSAVMAVVFSLFILVPALVQLNQHMRGPADRQKEQ